MLPKKPLEDLLKSVELDITPLAMEIDFKTSDHVAAMEEVAEQCISTKYCI